MFFKIILALLPYIVDSIKKHIQKSDSKTDDKVLAVSKQLLPITVDLAQSYISSTDNDLDDKLLKIVKDSSHYLATQDNNTLSENSAFMVSSAVMKV